MKPQVSEWLTEEAVQKTKNELIVKYVRSLIRHQGITEDEALEALEITREEFEAAQK